MCLHVTWHWDALVQPFLPWKRINYCILWVCVCSLWYPACNAHAPYCHLWRDQLYSIFAHCHINGKIFEEKLFNLHFMFWFCLKYFSFEEELDEICSYMYINLQVQYPLFSSDFNETWIFWTDFGKKTLSNFMEIRPVGAELFHADRPDEVQ